MAFAHRRHLGQRVLDTGARFAVDHDHVADRVVGLEFFVERRGRHRLVLGEGQHRRTAAHQLRQPGRALAIGAVVQHQHVAVAWHHRGHRGLDAEGTAALQGNDDMAVLAVHDVEQARAQAGGDGIEVRVPGAPVAQHRQLGAQRGGQRARGQQDAVAVHVRGSSVRWSA